MKHASTFSTTSRHLPAAGGFGRAGPADRPASAFPSRGPSNTPARQSRDTANTLPHDTPARSFGDIALDPVRWVTASKPRKIGLGVGIGLFALIALL